MTAVLRNLQRTVANVVRGRGAVEFCDSCSTVNDAVIRSDARRADMQVLHAKYGVRQ
ncbi:hypothetical protein GCM10020229_52020 [Kitasatospora albolonga]|uniref:hypothetical protein n=1 Tax=Kitasatospora albolonga TaxID=68173 RepID=UPI0031E9CF4C